MSNFVNKQFLVDKMKNAKVRVRILGVIAFDFDWMEVRDIWKEKIDAGLLQVEIVMESEQEAHKKSVIAADRRISGLKRSYEYANFLTILNAPLMDLRKYFSDCNCKNLEPIEDMKKDPNYTDDYKQCFILRTCYLEIPYPLINIDDEYYVGMPFTKFNDIDKFEQIDESNPFWEDGWKKYIHAFLESEYGATKYSTEETKKGNRLEIIQDYSNGQRVSMGVMPRDSFLNTSHAKSVVWALIFTRDGRLLIQQRSLNAKDNQGMWDKSVGGHISIDDIASEKAVAREIAEELYTMEANEQGAHGKTDFVKVNEDKMIFLGEWLPGRRYILPANDINNRKDEFYFFRIDYDFSKTVQNSPRVLPNGKKLDVSVYADVFVCIASENFENEISKLQNAKYRLVELYELKDALNNGFIEFEDEVSDANKLENLSPDLQNIIRSSLWQELVEFSDYLVKMGRKSKNN